MAPLRARNRSGSALQTSSESLLKMQLLTITATLANSSKRREPTEQENESRGNNRPSTSMPSVPSPSARVLVDNPSTSPLLFESSSTGNDAVTVYDKPKATGAMITGTGAASNQANVPSEKIHVTQPIVGGVKNGGKDTINTMHEPKEMSALLLDPIKSSAVKQTENIQPLDARLENMLTPAHNLAPFLVGPLLQGTRNDRNRDIGLAEKYFAVALQLEKLGVNWRMIQGWTKYLFSVGPNGHDALRTKYQLVKDANAELDALIKRVSEEEALHSAIQEKKLSCRLLLSNVAAGADPEDIVELLWEFRSAIKYIEMLRRDPVSRAQTACVHMHTKDAAKQASYTVGDIFGLIVHIRIAREAE